jgi:hypothetical protein
MKKELSEHSKELRIKTSAEWQKKAILNGGYRFTVLVKDPKEAEIIRKIPNKAQFLHEAVEKLIIKKQIA